MISKKINSSPMYYYISEKRHKETVLFIHVDFADNTQYLKQIEEFSRKFTVITVDLIGHGTQKGDGIEKTSKYIKAILQEEKIRKVHLVGVSIGADAIFVLGVPTFYPKFGFIVTEKQTPYPEFATGEDWMALELTDCILQKLNGKTIAVEPFMKPIF